jgi:hypothetical protein
MDGQYAIEDAKERREPVSVTLADLSMLVLGAALATYVPLMHRPADRINVANIPMPGWIAWLFVLAEFAMRVGLTLTPVIVARRARYGGLPRPADWLSIVVGLQLLRDEMQWSGWMRRLARWYLADLGFSLGYAVPFRPGKTFPGDGRLIVGYDGFPADFTPGDEYHLGGWLGTVLLLIVSVTLGVGRKRLPGWAKTGLLSVAALTWLEGATYLFTPGLMRFSEAAGDWVGLPSSILVQVALGVATLPEGLLFGVPVVAILIELQTGGIGKWVWTEWIGASTGLLALLIGVMIYMYADLVGPMDTAATTRLAIQFVRPVVVGLSAWIITKRLGWAGARSGSMA